MIDGLDEAHGGQPVGQLPRAVDGVEPVAAALQRIAEPKLALLDDVGSQVVQPVALPEAHDLRFGERRARERQGVGAEMVAVGVVLQRAHHVVAARGEPARQVVQGGTSQVIDAVIEVDDARRLAASSAFICGSGSPLHTTMAFTEAAARLSRSARKSGLSPNFTYLTAIA
ncbi:hypothetical protein [Xanthobacter pseudotagetidis]|uniref:hypothetical protein n=1 Tax=Xanthobacter pseudotagetidis TaxID=3119911 RepID=UPI003729D41D